MAMLTPYLAAHVPNVHWTIMTPNHVVGNQETPTHHSFQARSIQTRAKASKDSFTTTTNWLPDTSLSKESIKQAQLADPVISEVIQWVVRGRYPDFQQFAQRDWK